MTTTTMMAMLLTKAAPLSAARPKKTGIFGPIHTRRDARNQATRDAHVLISVHIKRAQHNTTSRTQQTV